MILAWDSRNGGQRGAIDGASRCLRDGGVDGHAFSLKSLALRPGDPSIEFAAALLAPNLDHMS